MWKNEIVFEVLQYSKNHIQGLISIGMVDEEKQFLTRDYGHSDADKRLDFQNLLRLVKPREAKLWVMISDFNEILHLSKKWGGKNRLKKQVEEFRRALIDYEV